MPGRYLWRLGESPGPALVWASSVVVEYTAVEAAGDVIMVDLGARYGQVVGNMGESGCVYSRSQPTGERQK